MLPTSNVLRSVQPRTLTASTVASPSGGPLGAARQTMTTARAQVMPRLRPLAGGVQQRTQPTVGDPNDNGAMAGQVFTPGGDPRLQGAQGATDAASQRVQQGAGYGSMAQGAYGRYRPLMGSGQVQGRFARTQVAGGPGVNAQESGRYLQQQDDALNSLGGPSRTELARQALADFDSGNAEGLQQRYRQVGQNAARLGRLGMGDTGKEAIDVGRAYEQDRMRYANELARSVAEGDIGDRFRRVDAVSGLRRGESGIESGLRGEARGERDYFTGLDERNVSRGLADRDYMTGLDERNVDRDFDRTRTALDASFGEAGQEMGDRYRRLDAAQGYEGDVFRQGQQNRDEFRGERGYQDARSDRRFDDLIRRRGMENDEQQQAFMRNYYRTQAGGR